MRKVVTRSPILVQYCLFSRAHFKRQCRDPTFSLFSLSFVIFVSSIIQLMLSVRILYTRHPLLKSVYSFGKWWKWQISLMGFVYRVVRILKSLWILLSETIHFLRKLHKTNIFGMPTKILYHRVMYRAPSSGHISLNFNMPLKLILRRFEVVFWCLEWECCTFWKNDGNSLKSTNTILWL